MVECPVLLRKNIETANGIFYAVYLKTLVGVQGILCLIFDKFLVAGDMAFILSYFVQLKSGKMILWYYLIWYFVTVSQNLD